jgi:hypothetical protein
MSNKMWPTLSRATRALFVCLALAGSLGTGRPALADSRFDGTWNLTFVTQGGACDPAYNFTIDGLNGSVSPQHHDVQRPCCSVGRRSRLGQSRAKIRVGIRQIVGSVGPGRLERPLG